jgi:hypothetical protein
MTLPMDKQCMVPGFKQKNGGVAVLSSEIKGCLESEGESEHGSGLNMWCRKGSLGHNFVTKCAEQHLDKILIHIRLKCIDRQYVTVL